jgi:hypothetical protein
MGECSWAKWLSVQVIERRGNDLHLDVVLLGGSSPDGGRTRPRITWNRAPHVLRIVCSYDRPSVKTGTQDTVLPLNPRLGVPGAFESAARIYYRTCHSEPDHGPDTAGRYGYNVRDEDN